LVVKLFYYISAAKATKNLQAQIVFCRKGKNMLIF